MEEVVWLLIVFDEYWGVVRLDLRISISLSHQVEKQYHSSVRPTI